MADGNRSGNRFTWGMQRLFSWDENEVESKKIVSKPFQHIEHPDHFQQRCEGSPAKANCALLPPEPELADEEAVATVVDTVPCAQRRGSHSARSFPEKNNNGGGEEEWELLSDKVSAASSNGIFVQKVGSVRSIASMEGHSKSSHTTTLSVPFKIQRTASSSTIDSSDNTLGPSGKGVLGVDYVEHVVLPTDTMQGICLAYKISTTRLRQANHFSGNSLLLAPKKLVVPISKKALRSGYIRVQDTDAKEYKLHAFLAENSDLSMTEATAYLELADWNLKDALLSAKEDREWEREIDASESSLKAGEIRITMSVEGGKPVGFNTLGAGIRKLHPPLENRHFTTTTKKGSCAAAASGKDEASKEDRRKVAPTSVATKTVSAQDVYKAVPQHENFGLEMGVLKERKSVSEDE